MLAKNKSGHILLEYLNVDEREIVKYKNITGAFAIINVKGKFLVGYNNWRKQREFPAGKIENGETPKEAAIRELEEETHQIVNDLEFRGLFKFQRANAEIAYRAIYLGYQDKLIPFIKRDNDEMDKIMLWDLNKNIGYVDECDLKMVELSCISQNEELHKKGDNK